MWFALLNGPLLAILLTKSNAISSNWSDDCCRLGASFNQFSITSRKRIK
jgi:hypothetical protein